MTSSLITLILIVVILNGWMYLQQPRMIFYPYAQLDASPKDWGLDYQDVALNTADGVRLHGWYIPCQGASRTVLFFHGNAGNISHRGDSIAVFHRLGLNVFIFDYRGYGLSQGKPSEAGLYEDATTVWRYLIEEQGMRRDNIIVFGRSLGGAVATRLAAEVQPGGLILESTFSSARDVAHAVLPLLSRLVFMRYVFNTAEHIKRVNSPVLVSHSPDDDIIPFHLGRKVYQAARQPKFFFAMRGDHNSGFIQSQPEYQQRLGEFIAGLRRK